MTIEEAKQMADQGDIGAMCSLGDFYIKQNTGEGIKEASKWYELAARKNVIYAIHMTVLSKKILAYSGLQVVAGYESEESVDFVKKNWEEVYDWASQEIEMLDDNVPGSEKIDIKQAVENYNDAILNSTNPFDDKKVYAALSELQDIEEDKYIIKRY